MSEYANKKTCGAFIAAVFAMQGFGILFGTILALVVSAAFRNAYPAPPYYVDAKASLVPEADYVWVWRVILITRNTKQAAADMSKVLNQDIAEEQEQVERQVVAAADWGLFSPQFLRRHGLHLLATSTTWFLLDIAFYSQNLFQKDCNDPKTGTARIFTTVQDVQL